MENEEFLRLCKAKVAEYTNSHMDKTDEKQITVQDVYVVWSCKTLQNSKALLSTTVPDGMYYELTYNGDKSPEVRVERVIPLRMHRNRSTTR